MAMMRHNYRYSGGRMPASAKPSPATIKRLLSYVTAKYKARFVVVFFCILISSSVGAAGSMFIRILIDNYISPLLLDNNPVFTGLLKTILFMASIYVVGILTALFYNRTMAIIAQGVLKTIRDDMFAHMQTLPIKYFDKHTHGDVMSYYTNDTDTLRQMISMSMPQLVASLLTMITVFCAMLYLNIPLTLTAVVFTVIMLTVAKKITGKARLSFRKQQESIAAVNGYIEEMIHGQKVVKVFCYEEEAKKKFDVLNDTLNNHAAAANSYANTLMPIIMNLGYLQYVFIAIIGGALAIHGVAGMTIGTIAAFLTLSRAFSQPIGQISQQVNSVVMALAGAERIFTHMDEQGEQDEGYVTLVRIKYVNGEITETDEQTHLWAWRHYHQADGSVTYVELKGDVQLENVEFGYVENKTVLHDMSLYAKPGEKIAFVGATGAGKTTITNLINRFYDIGSGKIRYDGINISKIKKPDLRRSLGIVLQDVNLFTGTIMDNIRYGKLDATDEQCVNAAKIANAHDFISRLPQGYATVIDGSGGSLSQGQRQLISIARAAIADPPVMILDEATSSIDTRTESIVQKGMDGLMEGRTVFVIAHRLSTVKNSHAIIVLENGRIIERGTHEELLAQKGKYYRLYTGDFELE